MDVIPGMLKKKIRFIRLSPKNCNGYNIYALYKDDTYASGVRKVLLEYVPNPQTPNPILKEIALESTPNPTWPLPEDAYMDTDHPFYLIHNDETISKMKYSFNRVTKKITLDTILVTYEPATDVMKLKYYRDLIELEYTLEQDCNIYVEPIFNKTYNIGEHNVIV